MATIEHELVHMLMYVTSSHKLNDLKTVKSGHTKVFKLLVYNIFGHYKVTHGYSIGDVKKSQEIKQDVQLGDFVEDSTKNVKGYVVGKKDRYLIICTTVNNENVYSTSMYNNLKKIAVDEEDKIDIVEMIDRLKPGVRIQYNKLKLIVKKVNTTTILAEADQKRLWKIPVFRVLDMVFLD